MDVGFIGLGAMGNAMAANLVKAGHRVRAWTRSGTGSEGLEIVGRPADAFQADVVFTMLSDDSAIREVLLDADVLKAARQGVVHVVSSTISVAFAGELAAAHETVGIGYVSAPVLGRPDVAKEGQLNVLAGGKRDAVETVRPLLEALGKTVWDMGEVPARANAAKIACQHDDHHGDRGDGGGGGADRGERPAARYLLRADPRHAVQRTVLRELQRQHREGKL